MSGNGKLYQGNSGYDMSGQVKSVHVWLVQVSSGSVMLGQVSSVCFRLGQFRSGISGKIRLDHVRSL
jgi:hypothetical protein